MDYEDVPPVSETLSRWQRAIEKAEAILAERPEATHVIGDLRCEIVDAMLGVMCSVQKEHGKNARLGDHYPDLAERHDVAINPHPPEVQFECSEFPNLNTDPDALDVETAADDFERIIERAEQLLDENQGATMVVGNLRCRACDAWCRLKVALEEREDDKSVTVGQCYPELERRYSDSFGVLRHSAPLEASA